MLSCHCGAVVKGVPDEGAGAAWPKPPTATECTTKSMHHVIILLSFGQPFPVRHIYPDYTCRARTYSLLLAHKHVGLDCGLIFENDVQCEVARKSRK